MRTFHHSPKEPMTSTPTVPAVCRRMTCWTWLVTAVAVILYSVILLPLYEWMKYDVLYASSAWLTVIEWLCQMVQTIGFFLAYAGIVYALWRGGLRGARGSLVAFGTLTVTKYVINFLATCLFEGAFPEWKLFVKGDLPLILPSLLLELLQHVLVVLVAWGVMRRYGRRHPRDAGLSEGDAFLAARQGVFPTAKIISWQNPLLRAILLSLILVLIGRLINYTVGIVSFAIMYDDTILWSTLLFEMLPDTLACLAGYLAAIMLFSAFDRRELLNFAEQQN